jgi:hypothetical protein
MNVPLVLQGVCNSVLFKPLNLCAFCADQCLAAMTSSGVKKVR